MLRMKSEKLQPKLKRKTTYVFIDATNIIYGATRLGWKVDFQKLHKYLRERFNAEKILYYAGVDDENKKQLRFYEKLQEFGYLLRLIPVKRFSDGSKKADVDSRMTFEMMLYFKEYKRAIVMTGDGDFYWVLEYIRDKKDKLTIIAFSRSTARELKHLVKSDFTDFNLLKNFVERK